LLPFLSLLVDVTFFVALIVTVFCQQLLLLLLLAPVGCCHWLIVASRYFYNAVVFTSCDEFAILSSPPKVAVFVAAD